MGEAQALDSRRDSLGLQRIEPLRRTVLDGAKATAARARFAHQHERRRRVCPAFADVRAKRLLADGRQTKLREDSARAEIVLTRRRSRAQPRGLALLAHARVLPRNPCRVASAPSWRGAARCRFGIHREDGREGVDQPGTHPREARLLAALALDRGHLHAVDRAGDYGAKIVELGGYVQRQTMVGHPAPDADADRSNLSHLAHLAHLALGYPHARLPLDPARHHVEGGERTDHHFFEPAQIAMQVASFAVEREDRIGDDLSRPMERRVAAAADAEQRHGEPLGGTAQVGFVAAPPDRVDRRMLDQ